jgi:hypothetical protein
MIDKYQYGHHTELSATTQSTQVSGYKSLHR